MPKLHRVEMSVTAAGLKRWMWLKRYLEGLSGGDMDDSVAFMVMLSLFVPELKQLARDDRIHTATAAINNERWRPIRGYRGVYEVSDHGRVRRIWHNADGSTRHKIKKPMTLAEYRYVRLSKKGSTSALLRVHALVAAAFLPPPPSRRHTQVDHIDGRKGNNYFRNLAWETPSRNRALVHVRRG